MREDGAAEARRVSTCRGLWRLRTAAVCCAVSAIAVGAGWLVWAGTAGAATPSVRSGTKTAAVTNSPSSPSPEQSASRSEPDEPAKAGAKSGSSKGKSYGLPQVGLINEQIRSSWQEQHLTPSPPATDGEWCRRLFLDVIGRVPSVDEVTRFMSDRRPDKKLQLVNQLLDDDQYVEEYARNWTALWTNILIGRAGGNDQDRMTNRQGLQQSLRLAFKRNMPYDTMVSKLISATGVNKPGDPQFNGFVNFLSGKLEDNAVQATAKTAQIFLGLQVQCTQCHNHPFNEWKQNQFWELNAFFRQLRAVVQRPRGGATARHSTCSW